MSIDLHTHSNRSDGVVEPAAVVARAAAAGLDGLALTDHDTVAGFEEARAACEYHELRFIGGVELSTEAQGRSVHVLGYFVAPEHPGLVKECARLHGERERRAVAMLARLHELGMDVPLTAVQALAGDAPIGRPHVAQALVDLGFVADHDEAFDNYLGEGRSCWVPKEALTPVEGVRLIRAAGGAAVLAHPGAGRDGGPVDEALVGRLAAEGLAGLEARHAGHRPDAVERWTRVAASLDLLVTGGSDFHGRHDNVDVGAATTTEDVVEALRERVADTATIGGEAPW